MVVIESQLHDWRIGTVPNRYAIHALPFCEFVRAFKAYQYADSNRSGEQRESMPSHIKKLRHAIENGKYTPTAFHAQVGPEAAVGDRLKLEIHPDFPAKLIDGEHRLKALRLLREDAVKTNNHDLASQIDCLMMPVMIQVDGNAKENFLNLQLGATCDKNHSLALSIQTGRIKKDEVHFERALKLAKLLNTTKTSPFHHMVRLDSIPGPVLPLATLVGGSSGSLSYSLVGLSKVGMAANIPVEHLSAFVPMMYDAILKNHHKLLDQKQFLSEPGIGTKGSATMWVGTAIMLASRCLVDEKTVPEPEDVSELCKSYWKECKHGVKDGNFSDPVKRGLMGLVAADYFGNDEIEKVEAVPVKLMRVLSKGCFGVTEALPYTSKKGVAPVEAN